MRVAIQTKYENVDQAWLDDYLSRLKEVPELGVVAEELKECGFARFSSKDPTSEVVATTTYQVIQ